MLGAFVLLLYLYDVGVSSTHISVLAVMLRATVKTDRDYFDDFFKSFKPQSDILSIIGNKV